MKFGVIVQFDGRTGTVSIADVARAAEAAGFESLWLGEHTHLPVHTRYAYAPEVHHDNCGQ